MGVSPWGGVGGGNPCLFGVSAPAAITNCHRLGINKHFLLSVLELDVCNQDASRAGFS
jgi:hypothetical protein